MTAAGLAGAAAPWLSMLLWVLAAWSAGKLYRDTRQGGGSA